MGKCRASFRLAVPACISFPRPHFYRVQFRHWDTDVWGVTLYGDCTHTCHAAVINVMGLGITEQCKGLMHGQDLYWKLPGN